MNHVPNLTRGRQPHNSAHLRWRVTMLNDPAGIACVHIVQGGVGGVPAICVLLVRLPSGSAPCMLFPLRYGSSILNYRCVCRFLSLRTLEQPPHFAFSKAPPYISLRYQTLIPLPNEYSPALFYPHVIFVLLCRL